MANHDQNGPVCQVLLIQNNFVLLVLMITELFVHRDALDAGKENSKDDLNDSIYLIIRESEEVETIAGNVASAGTEEGLKEVMALLLSSLGLYYCNVPVCRQ